MTNPYLLFRQKSFDFLYLTCYISTQVILYYPIGKEVEKTMNKRDIQAQIAELKMDYINLQGDIEKLESTGHNDMVAQAEQRLANMEERLKELNTQLASL